MPPKRAAQSPEARAALTKKHKERIAATARLVFACAATLIVCLGVFIITLSAMRAHHYSVTHHSSASHVDRDSLPAHHDTDYKTRRRRADVFKTAQRQHEANVDELRDLRALQKLGDQDILVNEQWLPRLRARHSKRKHKKAHADEGDDDEHRRRRRRHSLDLTQNAERISHDTYFLGKHPHPTQPHKEVEGYAFVHYHGHSPKALAAARRADEDRAKYNHFNRSDDVHGGVLKKPASKYNAVQPPTTKERALVSHLEPLKHERRKRGGDDGDGNEAWEHIECAAPIRHGARMRHTAGYFLHTDNDSGLGSKQVTLAVEAAMDTWRCVFKRLDMETIGPLLGVIERPDDADVDAEPEEPIVFDRPTGENHIGFGVLRLPDGGEDETLGVTISFGVFGADDPDDRYLSEFKTIYNDEYAWGICSDGNDDDDDCTRSEAVDLQSIAVHESGHAFGLDDLYASKCREATMYWSSPPGDTSKRTLEDDDVEGMLALYRL